MNRTSGAASIGFRVVQRPTLSGRKFQGHRAARARPGGQAYLNIPLELRQLPPKTGRVKKEKMEKVENMEKIIAILEKIIVTIPSSLRSLCMLLRKLPL